MGFFSKFGDFVKFKLKPPGIVVKDGEIPKHNVKCKDYYPLGTFVRMKNGEIPILIIGIRPSMAPEDDAPINGMIVTITQPLTEYDYLGVPFPPGYFDGNYLCFMHEDIEEVVHPGYADDRWREFLDKVAEHYGENDE